MIRCVAMKKMNLPVARAKKKGTIAWLSIFSADEDHWTMVAG